MGRILKNLRLSSLYFYDIKITFLDKIMMIVNANFFSLMSLSGYNPSEFMTL